MTEHTTISLRYRIWPYFYIRKDSENNRRCKNVYEKLVRGQKIELYAYHGDFAITEDH